MRASALFLCGAVTAASVAVGIGATAPAHANPDGDARAIVLAAQTASPAPADLPPANPPPPHSAAEACSVARMEAAALAVVEPCTALLADKSLSPERRAELLFIRGRAYHRVGSIDLAAEDYDAAIALTPNNEEIYLASANIDFRRGLDTEALGKIQKAIAINPTSPRVLRSIGAVFSSAGQTEGALRFLNSALRIDPKEPYALLLRSQINAQKRNFETAVADATTLIDIPAEEINRNGYLDADGKQRDFHAAALLHRADLYEQLGRPDAAEADYDRAVAYQASPFALLARGEFLANRQGRETAALRDLDAVLRDEPREARAHFSRGVALTNLRRHADAIKAFDEAVKAQSSFPAAFRMRARANRELGRSEAAINDFVTALRQDSTMMRQIMPALSSGGYWPSAEIPTAITAELRSAILKCMNDRKCN